MKRHKTPPMYDSEMPENYLTADDYALLLEHSTIIAPYLRGKIEWPEKELNKKLSTAGRKKISLIQDRLRSVGYGVDGIDESERLIFRQMRKSEVQMKMEKYMPELPSKPTKVQVEQMKNQCRCKFGDIGV